MPDTPHLPPAVAAELALHLRSALYTPLNNNVQYLESECETAMQAQKEALVDVQAVIAEVVEPTAERLIPVAEELKDVYRQIEILEELVKRTGENIRSMTGKVEATEAALRREERALDEGKMLPLWREFEKGRVFRPTEWVEGGRLKEPGERLEERAGTPVGVGS